MHLALRHGVGLITGLVLVLKVALAPAWAQFDPARLKPEPPRVAQAYADPVLPYTSPGLRPGRQDFASHAEVMAFAQALAHSSPRVKLELAGLSQQGRPMPLLLLTGSAGYRADLPSVLVLGQQHGNEPAGGEAALALAEQLAGAHAALLQQVNVLIVPRANPDGADRFARVTASGIDVNRDHLLLRTPEAQAITQLAGTYRPQVVLDLHEFTVGDRWVAKYGVLQKYDALVQAASVGNLGATIAAAQNTYVDAVRQALTGVGQQPFWYHTTSGNPDDKVVAMGGVQPDTGRNVSGLRQAVSLLIETRGVGLGRSHFARRVQAHVVAALAVISTAAHQGADLVALGRQADAEARDQACQGQLVVEARQTPTRQVMEFWDATTGEPRSMDVAWRSALELQVVRQRPRPCGYLLAASEKRALERLRRLGAQVQLASEVQAAGMPWALERYQVESVDEGRRQDARGAIEDGEAIRLLKVRTEPVRALASAGAYYIPLAQPLSGLISAALEPDSQNSFAANRLLDIGNGGLLRVLQLPAR